MNFKLLKELSKQAETECGWSEVKFAELIVRECDRYVAEHYDEMEPWMQPGDLLEHFGLEN